MKVILDALLFEPGQSDSLVLLALLYLGYEGRHMMIPDPIEDPRIESWLGFRGNSEADASRLAFEAGLREQTRTPNTPLSVRVMPGRNPPRLEVHQLILSLPDALSFLGSAFTILVENRMSDRCFLLAIMRSEWRDKILAMEERGWLRFEHGGGVPSMIDFVTDVSGSVTRKSSIWVLFDSDAIAPGRLGPNVPALINLCRRHVPFHCLERRAIENYIPYLALEHWVEYGPGEPEVKRPKLRAFQQATSLQRAHLNMKFGFHGDSNRDDRQMVGTLYDDLAPQHRQALETGFGPRISQIFEWYNCSTWDWWMTAAQHGNEPQQIVEALFSRI
jgi:hypothetical protein